MTKRIFLFIALITSLFSCATVQKNCPNTPEKVTGAKVEKPAIVEEIIDPESKLDPKGDDHNKLLLEEGEEPLLIKNYFPKKVAVKENEFADATILPGEVAEFSFSSEQERSWRILIKNDADVIKKRIFYVAYFLCSAEQPNIFVAIGAQAVNERTNFYYESRKGEILKIVIKNDYEHLLLPLTVFAGQYTKRHKTNKMDVPQR